MTSLVAAALALVGAAVGLIWPGPIYGDETRMLTSQALAQDLVTAFVAAPLLIVVTVLGRRDSRVAVLIKVGVLAFLVYNYAIYCFSIHFGPLFPVWTAVLGLSVFALVMELPSLDRSHAEPSHPRLVGCTVFGIAAIFTALWLSEVVPDLLAGRPSSSAADWAVPTNPVHVLDLALFLPAALIIGWNTLKGRHHGAVMAPGALVFFSLTCVPILVTPLVQVLRGDVAKWAPFAPMTLVLVWCLVALAAAIRPAANDVTSRGAQERPQRGSSRGR